MYSALAPCYDRLMTDVDYEGWSEYICGTIDRLTGNRAKRVLDIGCGTGEMTIRLSRRGYEMTGLDLSPEMLSLAENKSRSEGLEITYALQDMRSLRLANRVDAVTCCLDGMGYLLSDRDFISCLKSVRKCLNPGGLLIFDVNTPYKFESIYADRDYILEDEGVLCAWHNEYDRESGICEFALSVFSENPDGSYSRSDELQRERCRDEKEIKTALLRTGFILRSLHGDFDGNPPASNAERWYFTAQLPE